MQAMSIDMNEEATPANTSTSLGSREVCQRIDENNVMDADEDVVDGLLIDVTAQGIPPYHDSGTPSDPTDDTGGIIAYAFTLMYSSSSLTVQDEEYDNPSVNILAANAGSSITNLGDVVPDDNADNEWDEAALDTGTVAPESGSGTLVRLTLVSENAATTGGHLLTLSRDSSQTAHLDYQGNPYLPILIQDAYVAINASCGDFDSDGVPDEQDACFALPGLPSNVGCPPPGPAVVGGTAGLLNDPDTASIDHAEGNGSLLTVSAVFVGAAALSVAAGLGWRLRDRRRRP